MIQRVNQESDAHKWTVYTLQASHVRRQEDICLRAMSLPRSFVGFPRATADDGLQFRSRKLCNIGSPTSRGETVRARVAA